MIFRSTRVLSAPHVPLCYAGLVRALRLERRKPRVLSARGIPIPVMRALAAGAGFEPASDSLTGSCMTVMLSGIGGDEATRTPIKLLAKQVPAVRLRPHVWSARADSNRGSPPSQGGVMFRLHHGPMVGKSGVEPAPSVLQTDARPHEQHPHGRPTPIRTEICAFGERRAEPLALPVFGGASRNRTSSALRPRRVSTAMPYHPAHAPFSSPAIAIATHRREKSSTKLDPRADARAVHCSRCSFQGSLG